MSLYAWTRELTRLKKVTEAQAKEILALKKKFKRLHKFVWPLVKHHRLWVKAERKAGRTSVKVPKSKSQKKKHSSTTLGRKMQNLEEDVSQRVQSTNEPMDFDSPTPLFSVAHDDIERKSAETEELNIEDV